MTLNINGHFNMKTSEIVITPNNEVLKWARENAGYTLAEITAQLIAQWKRLDEDALINWEKGIEKPTFNQLRFLSEKYKIPFAAFFSQSVPKQKNVPPEFRNLARSGQIRLTPKVLLAIRKARLLQQNIQKISELLEVDYQFKFSEYNRGNIDAKTLAITMRKELGYNANTILEIKKKRLTPFTYLRNKIEEANCIVVKSTYTNAFCNDDARAFSLVDAQPFLINVTNDDTETGKLFSLMHEFGHVLVRESSIVAGNEVNLLEKNNKTEKYCNDFASHFLVDRDELEHYYNINKDKNIEITIERLLSIFRVSYFVILIALNDIGVVDDMTCKKMFSKRVKLYKRVKSNGGAFYPEREVFNRFGAKVVSLFVRAEMQEKISYTDVSDYLGVRPKYLLDVYNLSING